MCKIVEILRQRRTVEPDSVVLDRDLNVPSDRFDPNRQKPIAYFRLQTVDDCIFNQRLDDELWGFDVGACRVEVDRGDELFPVTELLNRQVGIDQGDRMGEGRFAFMAVDRRAEQFP